MIIISALFICSVLSSCLCLRAIQKKKRYYIQKIGKWLEVIFWLAITFLFMSAWVEQIAKLRWLAT